VRIGLFTDQRKYQDALNLLDGIPDTPGNFFPAGGRGPKAQQQADLYWLMGDQALARRLYEQALPAVRLQLAMQQGIDRAFMWDSIADVELRLGHHEDGLGALAKAQAIANKIQDYTDGPAIRLLDAGLYVKASRPDLAVSLAVARPLRCLASAAFTRP
jgi:tetratricopeptide (TPR) repeat protein